jgi:hypothetical protein
MRRNSSWSKFSETGRTSLRQVTRTGQRRALSRDRFRYIVEASRLINDGME